MSSQSPSNDSIALLISVQKYLYRFGGPIFMILGSIMLRNHFDCLYSQKSTQKSMFKSILQCILLPIFFTFIRPYYLLFSQMATISKLVYTI